MSEIREKSAPVSKVEQAFRISEDFMDQWHRRCDDYYSLYRAAPNQQLYRIVTRSNYVVPVIYKTIEAILPRIFSILFSAHPPIQSRYRVKTDQGEFKLRALDELFEYFFDHYFGQTTVQAWIKDSLIYGQSYLKVGWKFKKRKGKRKTLQALDLDEAFGDLADQVGVQEVIEDFEEIVEDRLDLSLVDVRDMFFSPEAVFPDPFGTAKYVIHRSRKRKSEILKLRDSGVYDHFDDDALSVQADEPTPKEKKAGAVYRSSSPVADYDDPMVTIYEYWEDERVITTAGHSVLLRDEPNPFGLPGRPKKKPFIACYDNIVPNELFQIGEAEPLAHNQIEMSTLRRQRTDNNSLSINSGYIYNRDAEVDIESAKLSRPGMMIGVRPLDGSLSNSIQPIPRRDVSVGDRDLAYLTQDSQDTSGLMDYAAGAAPQRRETATTVQLLQSAANLRFDIKIRNYSEAFVQLGYMMFERWKQFLTRPVKIRVPRDMGQGFEYIEITREELPDYDEVDLVAPGNPGLLAKDARAQKLLQFYNGLAQNPAANPQAAFKMFILALKEAEIDGIESIIQLLEQPAMPSPQGSTGDSNAPQPPSAPPVNPQVNENPIMAVGSPER